VQPHPAGYGPRMELRQMLDELAERLHLTSGPGEERAKALHADVRRAIDEDDNEGLGDRFTEEAVEFESEHPELADFLRRLADHLSAGGL
jgi:hypothetical protein